mgnify:CR=1 FL=1
MVEIRVLIAAAGRGSRSGLSYPKTLFPFEGRPILHRLLSTLSRYDSSPTVVVSPKGLPRIRNSLRMAGLKANLVIQPVPLGMGDAVLCFEKSPTALGAEHILLAWGDLANLQDQTVATLVENHLMAQNDFTFVTRLTQMPYTFVIRNCSNRVISVSESHESQIIRPIQGERDVGLFIFRPDPVFSMLRSDQPGKFGDRSGEHGFLYVIKHLVRAGLRVEALPIAREEDLVSLNSLSDLSPSTKSQNLSI